MRDMSDIDLSTAFDVVMERLDRHRPGTTDLQIERILRHVEKVCPSRKPDIEAFRKAVGNEPRMIEGTDGFRFDVWRMEASGALRFNAR